MEIQKAFDSVTHLFYKNENIKGNNIFQDIFLYCAHANNATFFVSDKDSVIKVMNPFDKFSLLFCLKPNKAKFEIAGIGVLKGVSLAFCGINCTDLTKNNKNFGYTFFL